MKMIDYINEAHKIYIVAHIRPDGDAIGSAFALMLALENMGKEAHVVMTSYAKKFEFLEEVKKAVNCISDGEYDLLICTDCSDKKRLDISCEDFEKAKHVIAFDHHKASVVPCDESIIDDVAPATCEIIYKFFKENNIEITPKIADYLYLGLMTDTGSFNYERTTEATYEIAADLIKKGARFVKICKTMNDAISEAKARLIAYSLENTKVYYGVKLRIAIATHEILDRFGVDKEEAEGITNYLRMIEGTELAVYIRGIENGKFKVSLRSVDYVDCAKLAMSFGGGGHIRAAGFDTDNVEDVVYKIVEKMKEGLEH